jgi:tight adherence protein B
MNWLIAMLAGVAFAALGELLFRPKNSAHKKVQKRAVKRSWLESIRMRREAAALVEQLPTSLRLFAGAIRAGNSLPQAMGVAARESENPLREGMEQAVTAMGLGAEAEVAIGDMAALYPGTDCGRDLGLLATAVAVNRTTGGPMADILDQMVETLQERRRLKAQVEALTAQGRMSGWIVGLLPVFLLAAMWFIDPDLVEPMFSTTIGLGMLGVAVILEVIGGLMIKRLVEVKV